MDVEMSAKCLAGYRVMKPGCIPYKAMNMTPDQILERRAYLRRVLLKTPWANSSNEVLDSIRVTFLLESNEMLLANEQEYEFLLSVRITDRAGSWRKARARIPFEFTNKELKDFDCTKYVGYGTESMKKMVENYVYKFPEFREKGMGLYIYSETKGSGKTMLSCAILNEISKKYAVNTKFVTVLDFVEMTKKSYDGDSDVKMLYDAAVLVLDDLGVQMSKEWIESSLYQLVNHRYNNRMPTIYTSNIPYAKLKMDDRIIDRIDATTYMLNIPEVPVRHIMKSAEKDRLMKEIVNKK